MTLPSHPGHLLLVGGPTAVLDLPTSTGGNIRVVVDPTFDPPTDYGVLVKIEGPAVPASELDDADLVLVSHAFHTDNLDRSGKSFALAAPRVLTTPSSAAELGGPARALDLWESVEVAPGVVVTAAPAVHGPVDGERDAAGFVNCEVTGFVLTSPAGTWYVSGDNTSLEYVAQVRERCGRVDLALLNAGRASVPAKFAGRPLSLSAERASAATQVLGAPHVVVAHQTQWQHFTEGPEDTRRAFAEAGIASVLDDVPLGIWSR